METWFRRCIASGTDWSRRIGLDVSHERHGGGVRKILHFDAEAGDYQSDAAVVWCFDSRFQTVYTKLVKRFGIRNPDQIKIAGGAKSLASPEREFERQFVLEQIRKSIRLHKTPLVILMVHSDCGAYGGLAAGFQGDRKKEAEHHEAELRRAAAILVGEIPDLQVRGYFVDFEGIWEVEPSPLATSTAKT